MGDTDTPDFNKARSYLIGFSTITMLLWYFGADLSTFTLLGNEVKLKENANDVRMVLGVINAYLWLRLYQRTPAGSLRFNLEMHELYESNLISTMKFLKKGEMRRHALQMIKEAPRVGNATTKLIKFTPRGKMAYDTSSSIIPQEHPTNKLEVIRKLSNESRNEIDYSFYIYCKVNENDSHISGGQILTVTPRSPITMAVKLYTFAKGSLVSPWLFDHVAPLILGALSTGVAFSKWWQINYPFL